MWQAPSLCSSGACVEVALLDDTVNVRASNDPEKVLTFTREEWDAFVEGAKSGEFDYA